MVASFHEIQSKRKNKRGLPHYSWVLQRALAGRSERTERSKGAQGRIMDQRPENWGALNKPTETARFVPRIVLGICLVPSCDYLGFRRKMVLGSVQGMLSGLFSGLFPRLSSSLFTT